MAITYSAERIGGQDGTALMALWETCTEADTANGLDVTEYDSAVVQVVGVFGTGGTVILQGSNDGANWATLNDAAAAAISLTAAGLAGVQELPRFIRPAVSAGTGVDVDVFLKLKRISSKRN